MTVNPIYTILYTNHIQNESLYFFLNPVEVIAKRQIEFFDKSCWSCWFLSWLLTHLLNPDRNTRQYRLYIHVINVGICESSHTSHNPKWRLEAMRNVTLPQWIFFAQNRKYPLNKCENKNYTQYTFCSKDFSTEKGVHYKKN